jgi:hypothetical protein
MSLSPDFYEVDDSKVPSFKFVSNPLNSEVFRISLDRPAEDKNKLDDIIIDEEYGPPPIFPISHLYHTRELPEDRHDPRYADRWPVGFDKTSDWLVIWKGQTLQIDKYLQEVRLPHRRTYVTAIEERNYRGTPWRLHIDHIKAARSQLPILRHGMTISYCNSNTKHLRYVIDHCVYQDQVNTYVKVFCFNLNQDVCEKDSNRPPFLLVVPSEYCQVRTYYSNDPRPSLSHIETPNASFFPPDFNPQPLRSSFSDDGELDKEPLNCIVRFLCRFYNKLMCC